jgi:hypothetical protein
MTARARSSLTPGIWARRAAAGSTRASGPAPASGPVVPSALMLWVPETSSGSYDQVIFVDQASDASLSSDTVLLKIDRFG